MYIEDKSSAILSPYFVDFGVYDISLSYSTNRQKLTGISLQLGKYLSTVRAPPRNGIDRLDDSREVFMHIYDDKVMLTKCNLHFEPIYGLQYF